VVACAALAIEPGGITFGGVRFGTGDRLTIDGTDGAVYAGAVQCERRRPQELLDRLAALRQRAASPPGHA
jgi:pyruvate,orthophosphate dikinase